MPDGKNPQAFNRYSYVANNPLKYNDPSGHCFIICAIGAAIIGAVVDFGAQVVNNVQQGMDLGQALTTNIDGGQVLAAAGIGAVAGGTLGLGTGLIAGAAAGGAGSVAAAATTTSGLVGSGLVGTGTGVIAGAGTTIGVNILTGQRTDTADLIINSAVGGATGLIGGVTSSANTIAATAYRVGTTAVGSTIASGLSDVAHGKSVDAGKALLSGGLSVFTGMFAEGAASWFRIPGGGPPPSPYSKLAKEMANLQSRYIIPTALADSLAGQIPVNLVRGWTENELK